jgi:hypothetical protein
MPASKRNLDTTAGRHLRHAEGENWLILGNANFN